MAEFFSVLDYDAEWGTMNGYAETYLDNMTVYYYDTCTASYLGYDSTTVDWGGMCVESASSYVATYSGDLVDGKDYALYTNHSLQAAFLYNELYYPNCNQYCSSYDDMFGFSLMSEGTSSWESEHWMNSNNSETPLSTQASKNGSTYTSTIHVTPTWAANVGFISQASNNQRSCDAGYAGWDRWLTLQLKYQARPGNLWVTGGLSAGVE